MEQAKIIELDDTNTCKICENGLAKYTCPRCNITYCSVSCYQSQTHLQCSEEFYHDFIITELNFQGEDSVSKRKMAAILHKFHAESTGNDAEMAEIDSDDDDEFPELMDRLHNVDLDDVQRVWELLSPDEKQEFEALVNSGDATKLVPIWSPWWEQKVEKKMVQEVGTSAELNYEKACPKIMEKINTFDQISRIKPAECVKFNILNVIAAYACTVRYFNGGYFDFSKEAVYLLINLSKNLQCNANFETYSLALESVHQQALVNEWMSADADIKTRIYKDVRNILGGPKNENEDYYLKSALSDIHKLLSHSKILVKATKTESEFSKKFKDIELPTEKTIPKEKLTSCMRKIDYYLTYVSTFVIDIK